MAMDICYPLLAFLAESAVKIGNCRSLKTIYLWAIDFNLYTAYNLTQFCLIYQGPSRSVKLEKCLATFTNIKALSFV